jgi:hypothetical protein
MTHKICRECQSELTCMRLGCRPLEIQYIGPEPEPTCWEVISAMVDRWRNVGAWLIVALFTGIVLWNQRMVLWDWLDTPLWPIFAAGLAP